MRTFAQPFAFLIATAIASSGSAAETKDPAVAEVEAALEAWRAAWEETAKVKNVDKLRTFYDPRFRKIDARRNLNQQMKRFLAQAKAAAEIKVQISGVKVTASKGAIVTEFNQTYAVPNYFEEGKKRLVWKKDATWRILEENFREDRSFVEGVKKRINKLGVWPSLTPDFPTVSSAGYVLDSHDLIEGKPFLMDCRFRRWLRTGRSSVTIQGICKTKGEICSCHDVSNEAPRDSCMKPGRCGKQVTKEKTWWRITVNEGDLVVDGESLNELTKEKLERGD